MDLISVTTCPRKDGASYLERTLTRLNATGANDWTSRVVFADGYYPEVPSNWERVCYPGPSGVRLAMWRVFTYAAGLNAERLLYLEDDITCCEDFCSYARTLHIPNDIAFVSFFRRWPQSNPVFGGYEKTPVRNFLWNQALLFPARTIDYLLKFDPLAIPVLNPNGKPPDPRNGADRTVAKLLDESSTPNYLLGYNSLVDHLGEISAVQSYTGNRQTPLYLGDNYRCK